MNVEFRGDDGQDVLVGSGANQKLLKAMAEAKAKSAAKAGGADGAEGSESEEERAEDAEKKEQGTKPMKQLLIWITQLPEADGRATLGELRVMGTWQGQNRVDDTSTAPSSAARGSAGRGNAAKGAGSPAEPAASGNGWVGKPGAGGPARAPPAIHSAAPDPLSCLAGAPAPSVSRWRGARVSKPRSRLTGGEGEGP